MYGVPVAGIMTIGNKFGMLNFLPSLLRTPVVLLVSVFGTIGLGMAFLTGKGQHQRRGCWPVTFRFFPCGFSWVLIFAQGIQIRLRPSYGWSCMKRLAGRKDLFASLFHTDCFVAIGMSNKFFAYIVLSHQDF